MAWDSKCHPWDTMPAFRHPWEFLYNILLLYLVSKERFPEMLVELHLSLCDILENSIFSCTHYSFGNIEYKQISQIVDYVTPPRLLLPLKQMPGYWLVCDKAKILVSQSRGHYKLTIIVWISNLIFHQNLPLWYLECTRDEVK